MIVVDGEAEVDEGGIDERESSCERAERWRRDETVGVRSERVGRGMRRARGGITARC